MTSKEDSFGCVGNTIKTSSGIYFDLLNPRPEDVRLKDIASALSKICRFGGHCDWYSVAEHSIIATRAASEDGLPNDALAAILLHDAAEAYTGDVVKPLKIALGDVFAKIERGIEDAIAVRFGVDFERHKEEIKTYDRIMLKAEKKHFWPEDCCTWNGFEQIECRDLELPMTYPVVAERAFLITARNLGIND